MRILPWLCVAALHVVCLSPSMGQEAPPTPGGAIGASKTNHYEALRDSNDRFTKQLADRYFNLVKLQEWTSDKGTAIRAKYVSHAADLKSVKLLVVRGYGGERSEKEMSVPVERLSKTCQSRVKQIATLQAKLDELAAGVTADGQPLAAESPEQGAPMLNDRGAEPRGEFADARTAAPAEAPGPATPAPSAAGSTAIVFDNDPDPLGFAELASGGGPPTTESDPTGEERR